MAVLDYFVNVNRQLTSPRLIDLSLADRPDPSSPIDARTDLWNGRQFLSALQKEIRRSRIDNAVLACGDRDNLLEARFIDLERSRRACDLRAIGEQPDVHLIRADRNLGR